MHRTHNVQAQNPFPGTTPAQASQPCRPAYMSNPLPPFQPATATGRVNVSATEMQSRLPPLPPQHAALYRTPSAYDVQAQYPVSGSTPAQASQPYRPAYVSDPLPPPRPATATGGANMSATEMQSRLPPLPPQHAALYGSYPPLWRDENRHASGIPETLNDLPFYSQSASSGVNRDVQKPSFSPSPQLSHMSDAEVKRQIADLEAEEAARNRGYKNIGTEPSGSRIRPNSGTGLAESFNIPGNYYPSTGQDSQPLAFRNSPTPASYRSTVTPDGKCTTCRRFEGEAFEPLHTKINRNVCSFSLAL